MKRSFAPTEGDKRLRNDSLTRAIFALLKEKGDLSTRQIMEGLKEKGWETESNSVSPIISRNVKKGLIAHIRGAVLDNQSYVRWKLTEQGEVHLQWQQRNKRVPYLQPTRVVLLLKLLDDMGPMATVRIIQHLEITLSEIVSLEKRGKVRRVGTVKVPRGGPSIIWEVTDLGIVALKGKAYAPKTVQ